MVLNNRMLARLKAVTRQYLKDTCTIEAQALTFDQYGGQDASQWQVIASNVPCRVITEGQGQGQGQEVGSQEALIDLYRIIVPVGTALATNQRITVNSVVYQVVKLVTARTDATDEQATVTRARTS